MKLTDAEFSTAAALGFEPTNHNLEGFAEACYDSNELAQIINCRTARADQGDMRTWEINETEWRAAQVQAIETAMFDHIN